VKISLISLLVGLNIMAAPYVGNPDFRGYLNYLSQNGDPGGNASVALQYVGNDGQLSNPKVMTSSGDAMQNWVNDQYSKYQGLNAPLSASAPAAGDPNTAAYYDDTARQLQGQMGQLDPQQAIGLQNIANSYNLQGNRLDQQKAAAQRDYNTGVQQNTQSYLNNRNGIMSNTSANANALQRLLGINGSGNSSAAYEQAPYAAALQGSTQLNGAQTTFGNNQSSLDTNWQDTQRGYGNAFEDLNNQKYQQENSLRASIAQARAGLLDKIAQASTNAGLARGQNYAQAAAGRAPYQSQIDSLLSQITQLGSQYSNPVMRTADVAYQAPNLGNYFLNGGQAQAAQSQQAQGGAAADISPTFLGLLSGQQRDQFGNLITA
jgi:hypothetical protein